MEVKVYENANAYLLDNKAMLLEREASSQLVLYDAYQASQRTESIKSLFGVVMDEGSIILHFSNVPSRNLSIYIQNDYMDILEAARFLADYISKNHILLEGLNAKEEVCKAFIEQYEKTVEGTFIKRMAMDIMEIRQVNEIKHIEGTTRLAIPNEVKLLTDWMVQFQIEALAKEIDYESAIVKISRLINYNKLYVFENPDETVVSMAATTRELVHGIAISYVYTPEEYRGMGYAVANIYNISKNYLEEGYEFCTLFVDKDNVLSKCAYEKVGYSILNNIYEFKLLQ